MQKHLPRLVMIMFVNFGSGKCPMCGDFARTVEKKIFHCGKCRIAFNEYYISAFGEVKDYNNKYWN